MKRRTWVMTLLFAVLASYGMSAAPTATAYTKSWTATCVNVEGNQRGLWDDMPGVASGGDGNEAGLFWVIPDSNVLNEQCAYSTSINPPISSTNYPKVRVRVALSDGAKFKVAVFEPELGLSCPNQLASYTTTDTDDDGAFRTLSIDLPPGRNICALQITLDDDPNSVASGRITALIDYIWIWDGANIGWSESFAGGNP